MGRSIPKSAGTPMTRVLLAYKKLLAQVIPIVLDGHEGSCFATPKWIRCGTEELWGIGSVCYKTHVFRDTCYSPQYGGNRIGFWWFTHNKRERDCFAVHRFYANLIYDMCYTTAPAYKNLTLHILHLNRNECVRRSLRNLNTTGVLGIICT